MNVYKYQSDAIRVQQRLGNLSYTGSIILLLVKYFRCQSGVLIYLLSRPFDVLRYNDPGCHIIHIVLSPAVVILISVTESADGATMVSHTPLIFHNAGYY